MKQGQIMGQIFIFALAAILFGLILLYGYKAITEFTQTREDVELIGMRDRLKSAVQQVSANYGSVKKYTLNIPTQYKHICFIEFIQDKQILQQVVTRMYEISPLAADAIEGGSEQNVFLIPFAQSEIIVPRLDIKDNGGETFFLCIPNPGGRLVLRLEGLGDRTQVSEWQAAA